MVHLKHCFHIMFKKWFEIYSGSWYYCWYYPTVLWHCWLGDRKGIRPVRKLDVGLLVVMELCMTYSSSSPVVTTTSIILFFSKHRLTQVHLENGRWNGERESWYYRCCVMCICFRYWIWPKPCMTASHLYSSCRCLLWRSSDARLPTVGRGYATTAWRTRWHRSSARGRRFSHGVETVDVTVFLYSFSVMSLHVGDTCVLLLSAIRHSRIVPALCPLCVQIDLTIILFKFQLITVSSNEISFHKQLDAY